jgi:trimethylamine---corrinoid protein Co-methyltransferase
VQPKLTLLPDADKAAAHASSLDILGRVGLRVDSPAARQILRRAGARFIAEDRCTLPSELVASALASAPRAVAVYNRRGALAFTLGRDSTRFGIGVTNLYYEDPLSGAIAPFTRAHLAASVRLGHALPEYDVISTLGVLQDEPVGRADLVATLETVANTTKPLVLLVSDPAQFVPALDLVAEVSGAPDGRPFILPYVNPITPLVLNAETTDKLTAAIERGLPVIFSNYGMAGASTPMSPLRTLTLLNAELLAGLVFAQAVRPDAPVILGSLPACFDMRTMVDFYDPRSFLINLACAEMMGWYGLPHAGTSGSGNGWGPDVIAAGELWFNHLVSATGGAGLVPFVGGNLGSKVFSPATVVLGAEVIAQAQVFAEGFAPEDAGGQLGEITAVGPGGSFLESPDTLWRLRTGYHSSRLFPNYGLEKWEELGRPSAEQRLREATAELMAHARPPEDRDAVLERGRPRITDHE